MVPASQTLNTQMAQIAYAAPETEENEVAPGKVKITLNKTRWEGKQKTIYEISMSMNDSWDFLLRPFKFTPPRCCTIGILIACEVSAS